MHIANGCHAQFFGRHPFQVSDLANGMAQRQMLPSPTRMHGIWLQ